MMNFVRKILFPSLLWYVMDCSVVDYEETRNASREFYSVLESGKWDTNERPLLSTGSVNVKLQISILDLGPIISKDFSFRIDYFIREWWTDERVKFSKGEVTLTRSMKNKMWTPDLYVVNSKEIKEHSLMDTYRTVVHSNGSIFWSTRVSEICSCKMDLRNYPMDDQVCSLDIESYAYNANELSLDWRVNPVEVSQGHLSVNGFEVKEITTEKTSTNYNGDPFHRLQLKIKVRRTLSNYVSRIYIPSSFLVVMTWGTFWLPPTTHPARVAIIVTNFLASVFLLRSNSNETKVPYATGIDVFFIVNITFIVACMIEYILTINQKRIFSCCHIRDGRLKVDEVEMCSTKDKESQLEPLTTTKKDQSVSNKSKTAVPLTDRISRILFPICYVLFLVIYFPRYLSSYSD